MVAIWALAWPVDWLQPVVGGRPLNGQIPALFKRQLTGLIARGVALVAHQHPEGRLLRVWPGPAVRVGVLL